MELEHVVCSSVNVRGGCCFVQHAADTQATSATYLFPTGAALCLCDVTDVHSQRLVRGHRARIGAIAVSRSGRIVVTGESGAAAIGGPGATACDVCIWQAVAGPAKDSMASMAGSAVAPTSALSLAWRIRELDRPIAAVDVCADDSLVAAVDVGGNIAIIDTSNGGVVYSAAVPAVLAQGDTPMFVAFGPRVQDVKRRDTDRFHIAVASQRTLVLFQLDPYQGTLTPLRSPALPAGGTRALCGTYSAAGDFFFAALDGGDLQVVHTETGALAASLTGVAPLGARGISLLPGGASDSDALRAGAGAKDAQAQFAYARVGPGTTRQSHFVLAGGDGTVTYLGIEDHSRPMLRVMGRRQLVASDAASSGPAVGAASRRGAPEQQQHKPAAASPLLSISLRGGLYQPLPASGSRDGCELLVTNAAGQTWALTVGSITSSAQQLQQQQQQQNVLGRYGASAAPVRGPALGGAPMLLADSHVAPLAKVLAHPSLPNVFCASSTDGALRRWDLDTYRTVRGFEGRGAKGSAAARPLPPGAATVASAPLRLGGGANTTSALPAGVVATSGAPVATAMHIITGLELLLTGWSDGDVRAYDFTNGELLWSVSPAHRTAVTALAVAPSMRFFVSGAEEGDVKVWDLRTRELRVQLLDHKQTIVQLHLLDTENHVITVSRDRRVLSWDISQQARVTDHEAQAGPLTCASIAADQCRVLVAGAGGPLVEFDLRQREAARHTVYAPSLSHTAQFVAGADGSPMTVSSATLMPGAAPRHCTTMQRCPLNDGMFATGGTDEVVCLWDDRTLRPMVVGSGHSAPVSSVTWACDGRQVLSGAVDSAVMLWNVYGQE